MKLPSRQIILIVLSKKNSPHLDTSHDLTKVLSLILVVGATDNDLTSS